MTNPNALPAGSVLSSGAYQYRVVKVLGSGGFGITYLVTSARKIGNITVTVRFAIKEHFLSEYCERDSDTLRIITGLGKQRETVDNSMKDFLGEARRLQRVGNGHPSIVKVNEVFEANGTAYYVMEYLEGKSLRAYVEEHGPLAEADALQLLAPVASAVDFLHSCRLTHLDIKPDNIIISEEENADGTTSMRPVLIDFGLSKHYDEEGNATSTINILGCSDGYAPIEQYAGITKFSPEADIYSLAATLLFCLTGTNPKKSTELIYVNMPDYLQGAVPGISPELKDLLLKALSAVPSNRPESLSGMLPAGTEPPRIKATATIPATPHVADTTETTLVAAPSRKRPILYLAIIGVLLVVALGLIFLTRGTGSNEELLAAAEGDSVENVVDSVADPSTLVADQNNKDDKKIVSVTQEVKESTPAVAEPASKQEQSSSFIKQVNGLTVETFNVNGVTFEMVKVEGGSFMMGSDEWNWTQPVHNESVSTFYIGKTEVTQQLWNAVMGSNPSELRGKDRPVESVSWLDCQEFVERLSRLTGRIFRLPSESEWEYAARGGNKSRGYTYSGSNNPDRVAWYENNCGRRTHPVAQKLDNELGIFDMSGNVYEWCADNWSSSYNQPRDSSSRVIRGGSRNTAGRNCRVAYRDGDAPGRRDFDYGLRLAL